MDKTSRSDRPGSKDTKTASSTTPKTDSRPIGEISQELLRDSLCTVNDKGEYCFGTSCFSIRVKPGAGEVRVVIDRNECGENTQRLVDTLFSEVIKGAKTVYETESKVEK